MDRDTTINPPVTLVDAHVHFHSCFPVDGFLASAAANMTAAARRIHLRCQSTGVLMLTESEGDDWFGWAAVRAVQRDEEPGVVGGWRFHSTAEKESLRAIGPHGEQLILVSGRQVVTAERLEVLWLGTAERPADGDPIDRVVAGARDAGAVPVVPWGFGKWMGRRGRILDSLLADGWLAGVLHLGDNSGRPGFWPEPRWFREADGRHRRVLPGTDPLPFPGEHSRPGRYGFWWRGELSRETPCRHLKELIDDPEVRFGVYGARETTVRFLRNQMAMQLRRRSAPIEGAVS